MAKSREAPGENGPAIVDERGSHLLVSAGGRFAVVERRNGKIYPARGGSRQAFPDTPDGMLAAIGDDWADKATALRLLEEIAKRGEALARRTW